MEESWATSTTDQLFSVKENQREIEREERRVVAPRLWIIERARARLVASGYIKVSSVIHRIYIKQ